MSEKSGCIYLLWLREFLNKDEAVYKVGRTNNLSQRMTQYPKGSRLIFSRWTADTCTSEAKVCAELSRYFLNRTDIGRGYYEGNVERIVSFIHDTLQAEHLPSSTAMALADFKLRDRAFQARLSNSVQKSTELLTSPSSGNATITEWFKNS